LRQTDTVFVVLYVTVRLSERSFIEIKTLSFHALPGALRALTEGVTAQSLENGHTKDKVATQYAKVAVSALKGLILRRVSREFEEG
jgi:hypothetical protein